MNVHKFFRLRKGIFSDKSWALYNVVLQFYWDIKSFIYLRKRTSISKSFYHVGLLNKNLIKQVDLLFGDKNGSSIDDPAEDLHLEYFSGSSSIKDK